MLKVESAPQMERQTTKPQHAHSSHVRSSEFAETISRMLGGADEPMALKMYKKFLAGPPMALKMYKKFLAGRKGIPVQKDLALINTMLDESKSVWFRSANYEEAFVKKEQDLYARILESAAQDGMKQQDAQQHMENFFYAIKGEKFEGKFAEAKKGGGKKQRGGASAFVVRSLTCLTILGGVFGTGYTFLLLLYFFGFDVIAGQVAANSRSRVDGCGDPVTGLTRHFTRRGFETWLDGPPPEGQVGIGGQDCSTSWTDLEGSGDRALERLLGYVAYFRLIAAGAGLYGYDAIYGMINGILDSWGLFPGNNPHNLGGGNKPTRRRRRKKRGGRKKTKRKARKSRKRRSTKRNHKRKKRKSRKH